ncbi:MAG: hypothetical protein ACI9ZV_000622 [Candidatus Azotimanducaceae bacterium]|jgi:hypothetical protein
MLFRPRILPLLLLCGISAFLHGQSQLRNYNFQVIVPGEKDDNAAFEKLYGNERRNNSLNRLSIISESQHEYPEPESGCGPIALLNTLVWYEKYGLIEPLFRESDPSIYKKRLFSEIDRRILRSAGVSRSEQNGSRNIDVAMVLDDIVKQQSGGKLRVHFDYLSAPLQLKDLLDTMPNFRAGYLIGRPKDPATGKMVSQLHAVTLIRADRAGYVTLGTWGEKYRGLLRMRGDEQWFIPQAPHNIEIKLIGLMRFIPFEPIADAGR